MQEKILKFSQSSFVGSELKQEKKELGFWAARK